MPASKRIERLLSPRPSQIASSAPGPSDPTDDTRIAFSKVRCSNGIIDRARAMSAASVASSRFGRLARSERASSRSASSSGSDGRRHRPRHRFAELGLGGRRHVPRLLLVRRHHVASVEERLVDHLRRGPGHPGAQDAGQRERVVDVAAEHLEQVRRVGFLELVVLQRAERDVRVAQARGHAVQQHHALAEHAERVGEHVGGVAAGPCRKPFAECRSRRSMRRRSRVQCCRCSTWPPRRRCKLASPNESPGPARASWQIGQVVDYRSGPDRTRDLSCRRRDQGAPVRGAAVLRGVRFDGGDPVDARRASGRARASSNRSVPPSSTCS